MNTIKRIMKSNCPHCEFLFKTFNPVERTDVTEREYWLMTEMFVYLHNGKDYCDYNNKQKG